jgi:hypothetical protein
MTTITGSFGTALQGTLASTATDTYKLTASASGAVHISFIHPDGPGTSGLGFSLQLTDALGNPLVTQTAYGNIAFDTTVGAPGDYYLKVIDANAYDGKAPGTYSVTAALSAKTGATYDGGANNDSAHALPATLGAPIVGSLMSGDTDVFKVHADAGGQVTLDFVHPNGVGTTGAAISIELTDAAGNSVIKDTTYGNTVLSTTVAGAGDYFVKVMDGNFYSSDDGGLYSLTPTVTSVAGTTYDGAANNTTATALASTMGAPIVGSLNSGDTDMFKVHADAGGVVTLDFTHPDGVGSSGAAISIELTDANGNTVVKGNTNGNTVLQTTVASAGDYYVKVMDGNFYSSDDGGIYTLKPILSTTAGTTYDGAANNTTATAIASAMGTPIVGSVNSGDTDVFKVHADAGGVVKLDFSHPNGVGSDGTAIAVELVDAAGNSLIKTTAYGNTVLTTTVAGAGDYFVKISDGNTYNSTDGGIYKLTPTLSTLDGVTYDGAANNTAATALQTALPGAVAGSLNNGDVDYFSFNAATAGTMTVNFVHPVGAGTSGPSIALAIIDAAGNTVATQAEQGNGTFTVSLANAGNYFLKVSDNAPYNYEDGGVYNVMLGLTGNGGSTLRGTAGADSLVSTSGNDVIDGGAGIDQVTYHGNAADYRIAITAAGVSVTDSTGKDGADTLFNVERLQFADQTVSLDTSGTAAQAYRVYQAAFNRAPDAAGLGFWIANMEKGASLASVASNFIGSQEFRDMYGAQPTNHDMVSKFYTNVLHRAPDQAGLDFWVKALDAHTVDAATVLSSFSESAENVAQLTGTISHGINYVPFGHA